MTILEEQRERRKEMTMTILGEEEGDDYTAGAEGEEEGDDNDYTGGGGRVLRTGRPPVGSVPHVSGAKTALFSGC